MLFTSYRSLFLFFHTQEFLIYMIINLPPTLNSLMKTTHVSHYCLVRLEYFQNTFQTSRRRASKRKLNAFGFQSPPFVDLGLFSGLERHTFPELKSTLC